jgi:hypothetical protein
MVLLDNMDLLREDGAPERRPVQEYPAGDWTACANWPEPAWTGFPLAGGIAKDDQRQTFHAVSRTLGTVMSTSAFQS